MSLTSKVQEYDTLVRELFRLLDLVEETDDGRTHRPIKIYCTRELDRLKLESVLSSLRNTLGDWG